MTSPRRSRVLAVVTAVLGVLATLACGATPHASASGGLPTAAQWYRDVDRAMQGSKAWIDRRTEHHPRHLVINADLDNTLLASHYNHMKPIPRVKDFVLHSKSRGVATVVNTARYGSDRALVRRKLRRGGVPVAEICMRKRGERIVHSKQRCRRHFVAEGYRLTVNIGNSPTDFRGLPRAEHEIHLPSYGGRLK